MRLSKAWVCALPIILACSVSAAEREPRVTYEVVRGWPKLPEGHSLGQATGVDVDSHDNVFVFHRAGRAWAGPAAAEDPTLKILDQPTIEVFSGSSGQHLRSWGANRFLLPHGLTIDRYDNIWLTDVGLHQVFKFSHDGKLLIVVGQARVAGADRSHFNMPTDVAVLPDGSFYVSDGYRNARVVKFDANGQYQFEWGQKGRRPGEFDVPHAIDLDAAGRVYVADRSNARIEVFDNAGKFLTQWSSAKLGRPYSIALSRARAVVIDGGDSPGSIQDHSGAAEIDLNGQILARFGTFGSYDGQFRVAHDVAIGRDESVYIVDAFGQRVQKFVRRRR